MMLFSRLIFTAVLFIFSQSLNAVQIVSIQLDYDNRTEVLDLELFDNQVAPTVANFMSYVNSGRYDATFVYRAIPNFIIQTGGFTFKPNDPLTDGLRPVDEPGSGLALIPEDSTVVINDPVLSNVRGTLALAKQSGNPDSGADEWFINLEDNSENLDNQNDGFTVFGSVIDDGMLLADEISLFEIQDFAAAILGLSSSELPVVNYDFVNFPLVLQENLVMMTSFTVIDRPILRASPSIIDFELDNATDGLGKTITLTVENTGTEILDIGTIANLATPYNITNDNCSSISLDPVIITPGSNCTIDIEFSAISVGTFDSSITIPYTSAVDLEAFTVSYDITGEGVPSTPVLDTSISSFIFTDTIIGATSETTMTIRNRGDGSLTINTLGISGTDSNQYSIDSAGCIAGIALTINQTCDVVITFAPITAGIKTASLDTNTNANTSNIALTGLATKPVIDIPAINTISASLNTTESEFVSIINTGTGALVINDITITGTGAASFSQINNCPDSNNSGTPTVTLGAGEQCLLLVTYAPLDGANKTATIVIQSNDPDTPTTNVNVSGIISDPFISTVSTFDLGTTEIGGTPSVKELIVTNTGLAPLQISGITGLAASDFSQTDDCGAQVTSNNTCSIFITYTPTTAGVVSTPLTITSDDPANPSIVVNITGFGIDSVINDPFISTIGSIDFGNGEIGSNAPTIDIIITNRGVTPLIISNITLLINSEFDQANDCIGAGIQLGLDETCIISVAYTAATLGAITDTLTVTSNDPNNPSIDVNITGFGVDNEIEEPSISTVSIFDAGTAQINGIPTQKRLIVTNNGIESLIISEISGLNSTGFSQENGCEGLSLQVESNLSCTIIITYAATTAGTVSDVLTIVSNDPVNPVINITINAFGDNDTDGILSNIELAGPNSGDGNNDGILDDIQNNVASLPAQNTNYVTFISDNSLVLDAETFMIDVAQVTDIPTPIPAAANFSYGLFSYAIRLPSADGADMAILLPSDENPETFYIYGPTADDPTNHWYDFSYDAATLTGARFLGKVSFSSPTGSTVNKNLVIVSYVDGRRGDDDLAVNGTILNNTNGLSLSAKSKSKSSSGMLSYLSVLALFIIRIFRTTENKKLVKTERSYT
ncbi:hypothetical protein MNBD_GAMMA05-614 [hydrothermal vent metagenome]|uniref:peptidylprolyl isomerase n=1 Tax=hydrothermal vent metagenome TaxID=652676 RepID=A0A3B0W831_9ZZZZ